MAREVKGPKPFSIAFRATFPKPNVAAKQLISWRNEEQKRHEAAMYAKAHLLGRQINEREELDERRQLDRLVQKRVDAEMQAYLAGEEERRERLRDLLEAEEKAYLAEIELQEETMEDRRKEMRLRAKQLRDKREEARRKVVAEKKEQQFRESCEELRTQWSKKHLMEVCEDRMAQLALKEELKKQKQMEEATYLALWEEDRLAKEKRDMEEAQKRQKEEEERLLFKLEDERAEMERRRKLRECRDMLLDSMEEKRKRLNEAKQEELALDMKILDRILQESQEDTEGQKQRKKELFKEQQLYRAYLAQQMEEEKQREKELDKLRAEETAKMWAERAAKEKALKDARETLLREVLDTRRLQIEEKLQRNAQEQEALAQDRELLNAALLEYNRLEEERYARRLRQEKEYREELQTQFSHIKQRQEAEKEEERREYEMALEAEKLYQQKIADVLSRPYMKMKDIHPLRRHLVRSAPS
nr:cilia- and flagella-associated protein 53 [Pogona vitticeps]